MKTKILHLGITFLFFGFLAIKTFAINYTINFTGTGASSTVDSVIVQNLTKGTTVIVPVGNVLNLSDATTAIEQINSNDESIHFYPGTVAGKFIVSFIAEQTGVAQINTYGRDGRKVVGINSYLQEGRNTFQLDLPKGVFIVKVSGTGFSCTSKLISHSGLDTKPYISLIGNEKVSSIKKQKNKNFTENKTLIYSVGDQLLYKGISGNYSTILTDIPLGNKTVNFEFAECKDADGNYYPIVKLGSQTWMGENLKTIKYLNGDNILNIQEDAAWRSWSLTTGAWCDYNNDAANGEKYGKLYNWFAVTDKRQLAPVGWHVPSDSEWTGLENYLSANGYNYDGTKNENRYAKSLAASTNWFTITDNNNNYLPIGSIGRDLIKNNSSGFNGLPGGHRDYMFYAIEYCGYWWSSTKNLSSPSSSNWFRTMNYNSCFVIRGDTVSQQGLSVRCIRDI
jgi:uncharacterized protein (TIGR02145 family)